MERTVSEVKGDYKTEGSAALSADAMAMRSGGDAPDQGQEQRDGRGEQETVHTLFPSRQLPNTIDRD
jgi:hypothetical protein